MKFVEFDSSGAKGAAQEGFRGVSRLPICGDGEYARFYNLSAAEYPVAAGDFYGEDGEIKIKGGSGDVICEGEKIGYVFEIKDGYMTGVYDGDFYFEGKKIDYYGPLKADFGIRADDKVEMVRVGKRYVILAKGKHKSRVWTYTPDGTSFGTGEERAGDGYLKTDILENVIEGGYLFKLTGGGDGCKVREIENATGKSYYAFFPYTSKTYSDRNVYPKEVARWRKVEEYAGHYGTVLYLKSDGANDRNKYCFDDFEEEHPVRFAVDAAGTSGTGGEIDPIAALYEIENEMYGVVKPESYESDRACYDPRNVNGRQIKVQRFDFDTKEYNGEFDFSVSAAGIIGHFEKWNGEKARYEFYDIGADVPIYDILDDEGNSQMRVYTQSGSYISKTAIWVNVIGMMNEAVTLSHMAVYGGRVCATVKDGSQVMFSALGQYTRFGEFGSAGTGSGFCESLSAGEFTGMCEYGGYLVLFKKNLMQLYYGSGAADMALSRTIKTGCIDGRSIAEVGGVLYFLSENGFCAFSGAGCENIGLSLGEKYTAAAYVGGGTRYAVAAECAGGRQVIEYDPRVGAWSEKSVPEGEIICYTAEGAVTSAAKLYKKCASGDWCIESGDIFDSNTAQRGIFELYIRARVKGYMEYTQYRTG